MKCEMCLKKTNKLIEKKSQTGSILNICINCFMYWGGD